MLLSVCSTVDAFLVLTFAGTFTTGALVAFLVFGPMVDIKSTLMFLTVFQRRAVALMIVLAAQFVLLATIFINLNRATDAGGATRRGAHRRRDGARTLRRERKGPLGRGAHPAFAVMRGGA